MGQPPVPWPGSRYMPACPFLAFNLGSRVQMLSEGGELLYGLLAFGSSKVDSGYLRSPEEGFGC